MEVETQNYLVKAVIGLLQEAVPFGSGKTRDQEETHRRTLQVLSSHDDDGRQENNSRGRSGIEGFQFCYRYFSESILGNLYIRPSGPILAGQKERKNDP